MDDIFPLARLDAFPRGLSPRFDGLASQKHASIRVLSPLSFLSDNDIFPSRLCLRQPATTFVPFHPNVTLRSLQRTLDELA